ncbi:maltokinase [Streptomyces sp. TRM 70351]|uniref:maltokinase N-terminal cap-like domain-containing protein n=1 Tax=Streptomyces sp. TRM 70351 TaxID=3116552 RepID=UPI002E7ABD5A|nr:maltokinase [Streptomyces sp. TRM 70351]MEE1927438.1 maltokinase [Streptomyces sp. TRM 70351]
MPDSSSPRVTGPPGGPAATELLRSLAPMLTRWLPRQRWFAGKGRPLDGLTLSAATELLPCAGAGPGLLHLLLEARQAETVDCYQLLLGVRPVMPPPLAPTLIGRPARGPLRGLAVYDAVPDERLTGVLLERLRTPGRLGALRFTREPGCALPGGLRARPLRAEQSNSSIVYGDTFILKLFRRVSPGVNPDLELPLALARTGCDRVPAPVAWFEASAADPLTLGVLQPYLTGSSDGWRLALHALHRRADFTGAAHALGRATAEVHTALAAALPTSVLRGEPLAALAEDMAGRLKLACDAVPQLRPYRAGLREAYAAVEELARAGEGHPVQRIHGDLHLGQVLRTATAGRGRGRGRDGGWSLIDFEGEPAKRLDERRRPQPVLQDVAGMLRSFDYAACQDGAGDFARSWAQANRDAFCAGYAAGGGTDPREHATLLRAYETDKAVYEVLYEAHHRPAWLPIPLAAIRRLAQAPQSPRRTAP